MSDELLSNRFAHLIEPAAVIKAVNDRGSLGALEGRVFRKLGPEFDPKAQDDDEFVEQRPAGSEIASRLDYLVHLAFDVPPVGLKQQG